jgi:ubiquinone/menaquinone biosynthesis C-methylase UbiE
MYEDSIREEFTHQSQSFGDSEAMSSEQTLGVLAELVPADPKARWLDVACGPGVVSRALAARVGTVTGVDLTPAMVEEAERRALDEGIDNVSFLLGDATALDFTDGSFDGAITRFSFHHIPVPSRVLAEMARLVQPGGWVVAGDQVTDDAGEAAAWHQEIERLRDPTHWASQRLGRLRAMGEEAGLELEEERLVPIEIDYEDWLARGSAGQSASPLIDKLLAERPGGAESFRVTAGPEGRRLHQRYWLGRWRRPA